MFGVYRARCPLGRRSDASLSAVMYALTIIALAVQNNVRSPLRYDMCPTYTVKPEMI